MLNDVLLITDKHKKAAAQIVERMGDFNKLEKFFKILYVSN